MVSMLTSGYVNMETILHFFYNFIFICGQIRILVCILNEDSYLLQFLFLQWNKTMLDLIR